MMNKRELRYFLKKIFKEKNKKIITKKELFMELRKRGFSDKEVIELYNLAAKYKIIRSGFLPKMDEETGEIGGDIVVEYMTADDWAALRAVEKATEPEEDLKWLLHEWDNVPPKEREKKLKKISKKFRQI